MKKIQQKLKKTQRRVDVEIVKRIIIILREDGKQRKTRVALKAHLAYNKCVRYLEWLELMGFIKKEDDHGFEIINLTDNGVELYQKYS